MFDKQGKKTLRDQVEDLAERIQPHVENAIDQITPVLEDARDRAGAAAGDARDKAAPFVSDAREKFVKDVVPAVRHHHESWDGTGYPDGLKGEAIPLWARILTFADTIDAMTTGRGRCRIAEPGSGRRARIAR